MIRTMAAAIVGGTIAAVITILWRPHVESPSAATANTDLEQIERRLLEQQARIDALAAAVDRLRFEPNAEAPVEYERDELAATQPRPVHPGAALASGGYRRVSSEALTEAGLDTASADRVADTVNDILADHADEIAAFEAQRTRVTSDVRELLLRQFDAHAYDCYLYATAQRNRLKIITVAEGSAAQSGGLQPGDVIRTIDGRRVFGMKDLAAVQSDPLLSDQLIEITVARNDRLLSAYVPRGQLGVRTGSVRVRPGPVAF